MFRLHGRRRPKRNRDPTPGPNRPMVPPLRPGGEIVNDPIGNPNSGAMPQDAPGRNGPLSLRERVQSLRLPDRPPPRRSPLALLPWVLCLIFFVAAVVMGMRAIPSTPSETDEEGRRDRDKSLAAVAPTGIAAGDVMLES